LHLLTKQNDPLLLVLSGALYPLQSSSRKELLDGAGLNWPSTRSRQNRTSFPLPRSLSRKRKACPPSSTCFVRCRAESAGDGRPPLSHFAPDFSPDLPLKIPSSPAEESRDGVSRPAPPSIVHFFFFSGVRRVLTFFALLFFVLADISTWLKNFSSSFRFPLARALHSSNLIRKPLSANGASARSLEGSGGCFSPLQSLSRAPFAPKRR